jgi:hypothetical protein
MGTPSGTKQKYYRADNPFIQLSGKKGEKTGSSLFSPLETHVK